jgi:cell wall assembly regulator SMI1
VAPIAASLERIEKWMAEHAPLLVGNLAPGAPASHLDAVEEKLGMALPADLRALWSLHDGQLKELNGFVENLDLYGAEQALTKQRRVLTFIGLLRDQPSSWGEAGVSDEEIASNAWLPLAGRDASFVVVSTLTGRVFRCGKDAPPLHRAATSVAEWLEQYASAIEAGAYELEEGFGTYYLQLQT